MHRFKNWLLGAALVMSMDVAQAVPVMQPETTPPPADGPLATQDIGAAFAHPLPEEEPAATPQDPIPPQARTEPPKDIMSLFQGGNQQAQNDQPKNPLEEEAKKEMLELNDPAEHSLPGAGGTTTPFSDPNSLDIKGANTPKEVDLDNPGGLDPKDLPAALKP